MGHKHEWVQYRDGKPPRCTCGVSRDQVRDAERAVIQTAWKFYLAKKNFHVETSDGYQDAFLVDAAEHDLLTAVAKLKELKELEGS